MKHKLATFFVKEKAKGRLAKDANAEHLAGFSIATIQGAMLMGKIERNSQPVQIRSRSLDASEAPRYYAQELKLATKDAASSIDW